MKIEQKLWLLMRLVTFLFLIPFIWFPLVGHNLCAQFLTQQLLFKYLANKWKQNYEALHSFGK